MGGELKDPVTPRGESESAVLFVLKALIEQVPFVAGHPLSLAT
jgi:hypothetical protein